MKSPLYGSYLKVSRAKIHLKELRGEIADFESRNPYKLIYSQEVDGGEIVVRLSVRESPPAQDWAVIIGDFFHNLRSALDLLACNLVKANTPEADCYNPKISFPISGSFDEFTQRGLKRVSGASDAAKSAIAKLKPYKTGNDLFFVISELNNADKHRLLLPSFAPLKIAETHIDWVRIDPNQDARIEAKKVLAPPFKDGAEIFRYVGINCTIRPNPTKEPATTLQVILRKTGVAENVELLPMMAECAKLVEDVLDLFLPLVPPAKEKSLS